MHRQPSSKPLHSNLQCARAYLGELELFVRRARPAGDAVVEAHRADDLDGAEWVCVPPVARALRVLLHGELARVKPVFVFAFGTSARLSGREGVLWRLTRP